MNVKILDRLFYLCIALGAGVFVLAQSTESEVWREASAAWLFGIGGAICGLRTWEAVLTGEYRPRRKKIRRDEHPIVFWSNVGFLMAVSAFLFGIGLYGAIFGLKLTG